MTKWWNRGFGLLVAVVGYFFFWQLHHQQKTLSWGSWQLTVNAEAHSGVLGVFAGFIAAIVVIFLTKNGGTPASEKTRDAQDVCKFAAIATFLCAFLHAILGAFQYASFTGFPEYWRGNSETVSSVSQLICRVLAGLAGKPETASSVGAEAFPSYLFNLLGFEYFLAVYLCFYGLVLTVCDLAARRGLVILVYFMLTMVYLLGSMWVFLDFAASRPPGSVPFDFLLAGALYIFPLAFVIGLVPRCSPKWVPLLLHLTLALSLLFAAGLGTWFALKSFVPRAAVSVYQVDQWVTGTLWILVGILTALFALFMFCLNGIMADTARREGWLASAPQRVLTPGPGAIE